MSMSLKCAGCQNPLPKKEYLKCSACKCKYDLECANISSRSFNLMERKDIWKCPECTSKRPKKGNVNTPVRNTAAPVEEMEDLESSYCAVVLEGNGNQNVTNRIKKKQQSPESNKSSLDIEHDSNKSIPSSPNSATLDELKTYMRELLHIQTESIREAINDLSHVIKSQNARIEQLEDRVTELESKLEEVRRPEASTLQSVVAQLQLDIQERDQALLANDIEIAGCTEVAGENCTHIALSVAQKIGLDLDERDIASAERAGPVRSTAEGGTLVRPRPIAVRLTRRATKDAILQAARTRRELNTAGLKLPEPVRTLYINERLTKQNRLIFMKARALARELKYKYVWTRDGKVFVRQEEGKLRHRLRSDDDLHKVFGKSNV